MRQATTCALFITPDCWHVEHSKVGQAFRKQAAACPNEPHYSPSQACGTTCATRGVGSVA